MDLTPEQCFERAMKKLERGKTDKAIKLLQIATLRDPSDARYREALQAARNLRESQASATQEASASPPAASPTAGDEAPPAPEQTSGEEDAEPLPSAPTSLAEASPQAIYEQAMAFKAEGKVDNAARMLQIAVAKDPSDARYREALESIRRPAKPAAVNKAEIDEQIQRAVQMSNFDEVERLLRDSLRDDREQPERLLMLSLLLLRVREDAKGALGPIRESVRLAPKRLSALVLQEEVLRALGDRAEATKAAQAIREISTDEERLAKARQRLDEAIPIRQKEAEAPTVSAATAAAGKSRQLLLIGLLALLIAVLGGIWFMGQPESIEAGPYSDQLPVLSAISGGGRDLVIRIDEKQWAAMRRDERASRLRGAMATASQEGFEAVFVHSSSDQFLGSVRGGKTFLPGN